jgi:mRNA interferase MazF
MIKRGQIYFIRSNRKEQGSEMWGDRQAVIVSCDELAETSPTVQLCYVTTRPKKDLPTHFITEGGLKPSTVICEQVSTVSTDRVGELIGECSPEEMHLLDQCLRKSLGLKQENNISTDTAKLIRERDLYKDLYKRLSNEILGK